MPLFSCLMICDEVAHCPAPTVGLIAQLAEHYTCDRGYGFESLPCLTFSVYILHNRDDVFHGKRIITVVVEILIAYDSVGAGQHT